MIQYLRFRVPQSCHRPCLGQITAFDVATLVIVVSKFANIVLVVAAVIVSTPDILVSLTVVVDFCREVVVIELCVISWYCCVTAQCKTVVIENDLIIIVAVHAIVSVGFIALTFIGCACFVIARTMFVVVAFVVVIFAVNTYEAHSW